VPFVEGVKGRDDMSERVVCGPLSREFSLQVTRQ